MVIRTTSIFITVRIQLHDIQPTSDGQNLAVIIPDVSLEMQHLYSVTPFELPRYLFLWWTELAVFIWQSSLASGIYNFDV